MTSGAPPVPPLPPPPSPKKIAKLWAAMRVRFTPKQIAGAVAMTAAFGVTVAIAVLGTSKSPPNASSAAALVLLAGALQIGGAWAFSARAQGTANADHAESSVQNLLRLFIRVQVVKSTAEKAVRKRSATADELRTALGDISVHSETLYERTEDAVGHWAQFYPQAVEEAKRKEKESNSG